MERNIQQLVSVIVPVYNGAGFITDTLESVRRQTHSRLECIIVDDGSTDDTAAIVKEWMVADKRFLYAYQPNKGLSAARNAGLERAMGDFIQFLDADDVLLPSKLERQLTFMLQTGAMASYTDYSSGMSGDIFKPHEFHTSVELHSTEQVVEFATRWETTLVIPPHCFLFTASFFRENGIRFDTTLPNHEDFDCWLNILRLHPQVGYLADKLCIYRITDGSMSKKMRSMGEGFIQVLDKQIQTPGQPAGLRKALIKKRLETLKRYNRIDLMTLREQTLLMRHILSYYYKRVLQKAGLTP
jgi:glycosyltransferase involved in cell wall biosynthesis